MTMKLHRYHYLAWLASLAATALVTYGLTRHQMHQPSSSAQAHHAHGGPTEADIARVKAVHHAERNRLPLQSQTPCRNGAFLEATYVINSVVEVANQLPAETKRMTRVELDNILFTAMKQAKNEVHCVAGTMTFGYDRSFAVSIEKGIKLAKSRGLAQEVIAMGETTIQSLQTNQVASK
jgi:hypothetical protein